MPREVGAPPGGPALVHTQIPVVFFTQSGVPGEVTEALPSPEGTVTAAMQAPGHAGWHRLVTVITLCIACLIVCCCALLL